MRTVSGSRQIEPLCLCSGPKLALSLALPQVQALLCRVRYTFLFQLPYVFMEGCLSWPGRRRLSPILLRHNHLRLLFDRGHFPKNMFNSAFKGLGQVRPQLSFDVALGPNRTPNEESIGVCHHTIQSADGS